MERRPKEKGVSRRDFLKGLGGGAVGAAAVSTGLLNPGRADAYPKELVGSVSERSLVNLKINGRRYRLEVDHRQTLVEVLRDQLGLTGTKIGCNRGECGACTVIINGRNHYSCSQLAIWMEGKEILTIEGLAQGGEARSTPEGLYRARRSPMRLLHLGTDHGGKGLTAPEFKSH